MNQEFKDIEWVPIEKIIPNKNNRNKHNEEQIERLAKILDSHGWRHPLLVSKRSNLLVAGHGRLLAAKQLKLETCPVHYQTFDSEEEEYQFAVADNAIASWAELDLAGIHLDLPNLEPFDIDLLGIKDFLFEPDPDKELIEDEVPNVPTNSKCKRDDLFILGNHRLLCGDSTNRAQIERLMAGEKADMVFTDPPYGINLDTDYTKMGDAALKHRKIEGDDKEFNPSHLFELSDEVFLWGANYYCWHLPRGSSWICWDKRSQGEERIGMMDDMFGSDFEMCWSKAKHQNKLARILKPTGRYAIHTDERFVHPTQKPVAMAEFFFGKWGKECVNVWDGYLGSGSTLIACEKTNRRCFGMEIDPLYCDVIIQRFETYSGKKAIREDGVPWGNL